MIISHRREQPKPLPEMNHFMTNATRLNGFPRLIHQVWINEHNIIPKDVKEWMIGCKSVNQDFTFKLYFERHILELLRDTYPEYLHLFHSLSINHKTLFGRVIIAYHFGGISAGLDFYCHRPFNCVEKNVMIKDEYISGKDYLIISRDSTINSNILWNKTQVVAPDFFMCSPKCSLLKSVLDQYNARFGEEMLNKERLSTVKDSHLNFEISLSGYLSNIRIGESRRSLIAPVAIGALPGVLSVKFPSNLNHDMDMIAKQWSLQIFGANPVTVFELSPETLHPLADFASLKRKCKKRQKQSMSTERLSTLCAQLHNKEYFHPSANTVAVRMWLNSEDTKEDSTLLKRAFLSEVYNSVEGVLPPTKRCHVSKSRQTKVGLRN